MRGKGAVQRIGAALLLAARVAAAEPEPEGSEAGDGDAAAAAEEAARPERELHVLLTGDEGIDGAGLQALKTALRDAGHRVTLVAPSRNRRGSSAAVSLEPVRVRSLAAAGEYAADAGPATCVALGLTALADPAQPFDVLLSGIDAAPNAGAAALVSGSVGATALAAMGLAGRLPAIALSTPEPNEELAGEEYQEHLEHVAEFAVRLLAHLARHPLRDGALLPPGTRLNVNYPLRAPEGIAGIQVAAQGRTAPYTLSFETRQPGVYVPQLRAARPPSAPDDADSSDLRALSQGYVAIVPLDTDHTAPRDVLTQTAQRLTDLSAVAPVDP
jgi:5'-nucleotidase